jgi:hypothetical protein
MMIALLQLWAYLLVRLRGDNTLRKTFTDHPSGKAGQRQGSSVTPSLITDCRESRPQIHSLT